MKNNTEVNSRPVIDRLYRWLSSCSTRCLFRISGWLAFLVVHSKNQLTQQSARNIRLCFPGLSGESQRTLLKNSIHHTCCAFFELAFLWYRPMNTVLSLVKERHIDNSFASPCHGRIIIAPHHGSWELLNLWLAESGPLFSLYKPAKSGRLDPLIRAKRSRNGASLVPVNTAGLRSLLKGLKSGASVMILPDQRPGPHAAQVDAEFFGHPAPTSLLIKNLASKVDCKIFIAAMTRSLASGSYSLLIRELDRDELIGDDESSARYMNRAIEQFIQPHMEQYQWPYRRYQRNQYKQISVG